MNVTDGFSCFLKDEEDTLNFAADLAGLCDVGDCIRLYGDVGSGKTTFARGFIKSLADCDGEVVSPTFTLLQTYPTRMGREVWHYDLYRLKNQEELLEIGLDDALSRGITLIEWPEIARFHLPENSLSVSLKLKGQGRSLICCGNTWDERLEKLQYWGNSAGYE